MAKNTAITLDAQVRELLNARRGDWTAVSIAGEVSYSWVSKFVNGHITNPGFQTLKRMHTYLTSGKRA